MANYLQIQLNGNSDHINIKQSVAMMCIQPTTCNISLSVNGYTENELKALNEENNAAVFLNKLMCAILAMSLHVSPMIVRCLF